MQRENERRSGALRGAFILAALLIVASAVAWGARILPALEIHPWPMPEFPNREAHAWINSEPLTVEDLKGKVLLLEVWTTS